AETFVETPAGDGSAERRHRNRHGERAAPDQDAVWSVDVGACRERVVLASLVRPQPAQPGTSVRPRGAPTWHQVDLIVGPRLDVETLEPNNELAVGQAHELRRARSPMVDARQPPRTQNSRTRDGCRRSR